MFQNETFKTEMQIIWKQNKTKTPLNKLLAMQNTVGFSKFLVVLGISEEERTIATFPKL